MMLYIESAQLLRDASGKSGRQVTLALGIHMMCGRDCTSFPFFSPFLFSCLSHHAGILKVGEVLMYMLASNVTVVGFDSQTPEM